jgi:hypothetical protein
MQEGSSENLVLVCQKTRRHSPQDGNTVQEFRNNAEQKHFKLYISQDVCFVDLQNNRMTGMTSLNTSFTVTFPQDWRNIAECGNLRAPSGVSS